MSLIVHNTTLQPLFSIYVPLLLGVVLIPDCILTVLLQCFQLTGLRLSFFLICDPPRPRTVWLVLRSVVPYRSNFLVFLPPLCASSLSTLNWPLGSATLYLSSNSFSDSWSNLSSFSVSSISDRLFYRPGILFPAAFFTPSTPWSSNRPQFLVAFPWSPF